MLLAARQSPTRVGSRRRWPSTRGCTVDRRHDEAGLFRHLLEDPLGIVRGWYQPRARSVLAGVRLEPAGSPVNGNPGRLQPRRGQKAGVRRGRDGIAPVRPRGQRGPPRLDGLQQRQAGIDRLVDLVDVDAHQHAERMPGDVVGRDGRSARVVAQVGIDLLLEHRLGEGAVRLREPDHPGAGRVVLAAGAERRPRPVDLDLAEVEDVQQLVGGERVPLDRRHDERVGRLVAVDPVAVNAVEVLHPARAVLRHVLKRGEGRNLAVLDDVAQAPYG